MEKRYRLFLINPGPRYHHHTSLREVSRLFGRRKMSVPLALPLIAALTPEHYEIKIFDEEIGPLPEGELPDLVGLTAMASNADRAYEIADRYRARGVPVIMGGSYASFRVEETLEHCTSVFVGEAEAGWDEVLRDFESGRMKPVYRGTRLDTFEARPAPRWDLVAPDDVFVYTLETSRGCPHSCDFCLVPSMYGRKMRYRPVEDIVREIRALPQNKAILFTDDNFAINKRRTREILAELRKLDVTWVCQADLNVADDPELLREMAEAGCNQILIGFESVDPRNLEHAGKGTNEVAEYERAIAAIHAAGIHIIASFIVGFDHDTEATFDRIYEFVMRNRLLFVMVSTMAVLPGTALYDKMTRRGRLFDVDTALRNGVFPNMHYQLMSQETILERYFDLLGRLYAFDSLLQRAPALLGSGAFTRPNSAGVTALDKVATFFKLLGRYGLTADAAKRRFFAELFSIGRSGVASMDAVMFCLLWLEAQRDYLKNAEAFLPEVRERVRAQDRGPFAALPAPKAGLTGQTARV